MILSMTGFGKAEGNFENKNIAIEIRSLNGKQLDIYTRIPNEYKDKDLEIRNFLKEKMQRGKVDFSLTVTTTAEEGTKELNQQLAKQYYEQLATLSAEIGLPIANANILDTLVRMPDVVATKEVVIDDSQWAELWEVINEAVANLNEFRQQEGQSLQQDLLANVSTIENLLKEVLVYENERIETVKQRIGEQLDKLKIEIDKERFEQELIYYLEKLDINEEKVRLSNHCQYFRETILSEEDSVGKKLGFIAQEMGREINTLGSKANHTMIQQLVVQMKEALEKIKEQVLNVL